MIPSPTGMKIRNVPLQHAVASTLYLYHCTTLQLISIVFAFSINDNHINQSALQTFLPSLKQTL